MSRQLLIYKGNSEIYLNSNVSKRITHRGVPYSDFGSFNDLVLSASLQHPRVNGDNTVVCQYSCSDIVQPYATGDLGCVTGSTNKAWLIDIISAVHYLHSQSYVHGDIKPDNILVYTTPDTGTTYCKLTDFGTTCIYGHRQALGTHNFWAPELFREPLMTFATDLYALGITLRRVFHHSVLTPSMARLTHSNPELRPTTGKLLSELQVMPSIVIPVWQPPCPQDVVGVETWVPQMLSPSIEITQMACRLLKYYFNIAVSPYIASGVVTISTAINQITLIALTRLAARLLLMHGYNVPMPATYHGVFVCELYIMNVLSGKLLLPVI